MAQYWKQPPPPKWCVLVLTGEAKYTFTVKVCCCLLCPLPLSDRPECCTRHQLIPTIVKQYVLYWSLIICRINLFLMRKTEWAIEEVLTDMLRTQTPPAPKSFLLNRRLPNRLRLHISPSLGFKGYYFVFPSLSEGSSFWGELRSNWTQEFNAG